MFDNVVRLIGFVGSDAELKTTKAQREYTVLSLATTGSWKDKNSDGYIRRTEWHKLVAWRNLSTFAATLKKGAHVSVEGELRYREFVPKKQKKSKNGDQKIRVAEIHLSKIAKLDRAEKRDSDALVPELGPETEAPRGGSLHHWLQTRLASATGLLVMLGRVQFLAEHPSSPVRYRLRSFTKLAANELCHHTVAAAMRRVVVHYQVISMFADFGKILWRLPVGINNT